MARPIFTHELADADFSWLLTTFKENNPSVVSIEIGGLPTLMLRLTPQELQRSMIPALPDLSDSDNNPLMELPESDKVKES